MSVSHLIRYYSIKKLLDVLILPTYESKDREMSKYFLTELLTRERERERGVVYRIFFVIL